MRMKDMAAVITGGTGGLGHAIAERFLREGAMVTCAARTPHDVEKLIREFPERAEYHQVDVTKPESVSELMADSASRWRRIDVLVANAAVIRDAKVEELDAGSWEEMVATNLAASSTASRRLPGR